MGLARKKCEIEKKKNKNGDLRRRRKEITKKNSGTSEPRLIFSYEVYLTKKWSRLSSKMQLTRM